MGSDYDDNSSASQIYIESYITRRLRTVFIICSTIQIICSGFRHYFSFTFSPHLSPLLAILPGGEKVSVSLTTELRTRNERHNGARRRPSPSAAPLLLLLRLADDAGGARRRACDGQRGGVRQRACGGLRGIARRRRSVTVAFGGGAEQ